jgi:hypothetical protein
MDTLIDDLRMSHVNTRSITPADEERLKRDYEILVEGEIWFQEALRNPRVMEFSGADGRLYRHTPDFEIIRKTGPAIVSGDDIPSFDEIWDESTIVEVRHSNHPDLRDPDFKARCAALELHCRMHCMKFEVVTEANIPVHRLENLKLIQRYRNWKNSMYIDSRVMGILEEAVCMPFRVLLEALRKDQPSLQNPREYLEGMMAVRSIYWNIDLKFDDDRLIFDWSCWEWDI